ncbi:hypothetical protein [Phaeovulum veldkampii]|uniref:Uncharacterized protein n=1 Tax=Phaeovulum veldkampii DSM 11550 TaxID=1185920 RepID=A0A2T4JJL2_9RHOB|nr:hypothetical protein [Phaeovulum veldkampii]PTE18072.1 hypothetical protein C5F46_05850 [Phaeovulum veldkampii DSM 11550]TDQ57125.1 hypothetical protein EV658_11487 [Phaeovulum veldkampii DSM 11550]
MINAELALWRMVLFMGLNDPDAARWMRGEDFRMVCALAGFDSAAVRRAVASGNLRPFGRKEAGDKSSDKGKISKKTRLRRASN